MRRLSDLGLIRYVQREYIELTSRGVEEAQRVYAKHEILTRFLEEFLHVPRDAAVQDACALEHSLSDASMDRLVGLFEFLRNCPEGRNDFIKRFHMCPLVQPDALDCSQKCIVENCRITAHEKRMKNITDLQPGNRGKVARVDAAGPLRQHLLDLGIIPDTIVELDRIEAKGDKARVRIQGYAVTLNREEAQAVLVNSVS